VRDDRSIDGGLGRCSTSQAAYSTYGLRASCFLLQRVMPDVAGGRAAQAQSLTQVRRREQRLTVVRDEFRGSVWHAH
jgi:hypothetical protein